MRVRGLQTGITRRTKWRPSEEVMPKLKVFDIKQHPSFWISGETRAFNDG